MMIRAYAREERRAAESRERRAKRSGQWGFWRCTELPHGAPGDSWMRDMRRAYANDLYAVLVRPLRSGVIHLAIRTATNAEPPWRDLQRIKNELVGLERFAVQVCPPDSRLIDQADMYHLFVMPEGHEPGFGLHPDDEKAPAQRETP